MVRTVQWYESRTRALLWVAAAMLAVAAAVAVGATAKAGERIPLPPPPGVADPPEDGVLIGYVWARDSRGHCSCGRLYRFTTD